MEGGIPGISTGTPRPSSERHRCRRLAGTAAQKMVMLCEIATVAVFFLSSTANGRRYSVWEQILGPRPFNSRL